MSFLSGKLQVATQQHWKLVHKTTVSNSYCVSSLLFPSPRYSLLGVISTPISLPSQHCPLRAHMAGSLFCLLQLWDHLNRIKPTAVIVYSLVKSHHYLCGISISLYKSYCIYLQTSFPPCFPEVRQMDVAPLCFIHSTFLDCILKLCVRRPSPPPVRLRKGLYCINLKPKFSCLYFVAICI